MHYMKLPLVYVIQLMKIPTLSAMCTFYNIFKLENKEDSFDTNKIILLSEESKLCLLTLNIIRKSMQHLRQKRKHQHNEKWTTTTYYTMNLFSFQAGET